MRDAFWPPFAPTARNDTPVSADDKKTPSEVQALQRNLVTAPA
jgi:hypothetical protein